MNAFERHKTEAVRLLSIKQYGGATKCFSDALAIKPNQVKCLISRSICYLINGFTNKALVDIDEALKHDPKNYKAMLQKGDVHFNKGQFEKALLWYHRGKTIRPELDTLSYSVDRAKRAIKNCVGNRVAMSLETTTIPSNVLSSKIESTENTEDNFIKTEFLYSKTLTEMAIDRRFLIDLLKEEEKRIVTFRDFSQTYNPGLKKLQARHKFCNFFYKITYDTGFRSFQIKKEVQKTLDFLEPKSDFWQQRYPFYSLKKKYRSKLIKKAAEIPKWSIHDIVLEFVHIEMLEFQGDYDKVVEKAENILRHLIDVFSVNDKAYEVISADLRSVIGNCFTELGMYSEALQHHEVDLQLGLRSKIRESRSRAMDYIGMLYFLDHHYDKAIDIWSQKLRYAKSSLESSWLFHEMSRCYMALERMEESLHFAEEALAKATQAMEERWQLNSLIQMAKAHEGLKRLQEATECYMKALDLARELKLTGVSNEIQRLIEDLMFKPENLSIQRSTLKESVLDIFSLRSTIKKISFSPNVPLESTEEDKTGGKSLETSDEMTKAASINTSRYMGSSRSSETTDKSSRSIKSG